MPACTYILASVVEDNDCWVHPCDNWCDAGEDYCPRHKKLMDEIDALDRTVRRIIRERTKQEKK